MIFNESPNRLRIVLLVLFSFNVFPLSSLFSRLEKQAHHPRFIPGWVLAPGVWTVLLASHAGLNDLLPAGTHLDVRKDVSRMVGMIMTG